MALDAYRIRFRKPGGQEGGDVQGPAFGVSPTIHQSNYKALSSLMRRETQCSFDNGS
jgi:hypothetical protein